MGLTPTQYAYQLRGQPLLSWVGGPPDQSRSASARSLGSLGDDDVFGIQRPLLPRPGAPEYLDDPIETLGGWGAPSSSSPPIKQYGLGGVPHKKCGCGCKGKKKGCGKKGIGEYVATGDVSSFVSANPVMAGALALGAFLLFKKLSKKR